MNKKFFAAAVALALSTPVFADSGFYIQADAGISKIKLKEDSGLNNGMTASESGFSPRLTVGYDFGNNWRVGVDYTRYKSSFEHTESDAALGLHNVGTLTGKIKKNVGVSVIYDFPVSEKVQPYLGARVGTNRVSYDYLELNRGNFNFEASGKETKTSVGALAGVGVKVSDKVTVDAGYRYNHWGKFFANAKINSHEFSAGVRVKF